MRLPVGGGGALLVTAHPDDETMFFTPAVRALVRKGTQLHVLCLSSGDYEGLGSVRSVELRHACASLGIPTERVTVVDDPRLRDGPSSAWPQDAVAQHVARHLDAATLHPVKCVLTFDCHGVTGHLNHIAVHHGTRCAVEAHGGVVLYELVSVNILRRYMGMVDAAVVSLLDACWRLAALLQMCVGPSRASTSDDADHVICCTSWTSWSCHQAMCRHWTQYTWYRRLYVLFSRYVYVNTLRRVVA